jgi:hypothetical protein
LPSYGLDLLQGIVWHSLFEMDAVSLALQTVHKDLKDHIKCKILQEADNVIPKMKERSTFLESERVDTNLYYPECLFQCILACRFARRLMNIARVKDPSSDLSPTMTLSREELASQMHRSIGNSSVSGEIKNEITSILFTLTCESLWMRTFNHNRAHKSLQDDVFVIIGQSTMVDDMNRRLYRLLSKHQHYRNHMGHSDPHLDAIEGGVGPRDQHIRIQKRREPKRAKAESIAFLRENWPGLFGTDIGLFSTIFHAEMIHSVLSFCRKQTDKIETFQNALTHWGRITEQDGTWPDRDRGTKEALFSHMFDIFKTWNGILTPPDPDATVEPSRPTVSSFFTAFVWYISLGGPVQTRTTAISGTKMEHVLHSDTDNLAVPIFMTNLLVDAVKRRCPELQSNLLELLVLQIVSTIQNCVVYIHQLLNFTNGVKYESDDMTNMTKLTELRLSRTLQRLHNQMDIPDHIIHYVCYLMGSACRIGMYTLLFQVSKLKVAAPLEVPLMDVPLMEVPLMEVPPRNICFMSTGPAIETLEYIDSMTDIPKIASIDNIFSTFLWVVQFIENFTKLPRDSVETQLIQHPHSTIPANPKAPVFQEEKLIKEGKDLKTKVSACQDNEQIILCLRTWLKERNYGERQYIAGTVSKKRSRGWGTIDY